MFFFCFVSVVIKSNVLNRHIRFSLFFRNILIIWGFLTAPPVNTHVHLGAVMVMTSFQTSCRGKFRHISACFAIFIQTNCCPSVWRAFFLKKKKKDEVERLPWNPHWLRIQTSLLRILSIFTLLWFILTRCPAGSSLFLSPFLAISSLRCFSSLNLLCCVLRLTSGSKTSSPNLTAHLGGGRRGRRPVAGPCVGSRRTNTPVETHRNSWHMGKVGSWQHNPPSADSYFKFCRSL